MSGGYFNYLYAADPEDMLSRRSELRRMANWLQDEHPEAAQDLALFAAYLDATTEQITARHKRLEDLMHAVEWRASCDWGADQLAKVVAALAPRGPGDA